MSRPRIPSGAVPIVGKIPAGAPRQPAVSVQDADGNTLAFPCTAAHLLTDHCKQELWQVVAAAVEAVMERRQLGVPLPPPPEPDAAAMDAPAEATA